MGRLWLMVVKVLHEKDALFGAGLVICGKCGRRMSPRYHGTGGKRTTYQCDQLRQQDGVH
ncbi:zinc ribbon domain-containing protein, partial [Tolypothrix sp. VBCCA 56010]|uniref:zinc ribbon domain-containing protein n=1 Tax=Tolypothrix sp. VBCCA 56010 TaxID=3137731 RepID=UPI003D7D5E2F